jgi:hypothetical protein
MFIINIIAGITRSLLFFIPTFNGLQIDQMNSVQSWASALHKANNLFPVATLLTVIGLVFTIEIAIMLFTFTEWIISKFWPTGQMSLFK